MTRILAILACLAGTAQAQYIYLDSNANGIHDGGDRLNPNGAPTTVDVWLNTIQNRDGSPAAPDVSGEPHTLFSYALNLLASNGSVSYAGFVNQQPTMNVHFLEFNPDGLRYKNGYGGMHILAPGKYRLCTITITGLSGEPTVDIVDIVTGSADFTSFGTHCWGQGFDNTYKLDGPITRASQGIADFYDADGLSEASGPAVTHPGNKTVAEGTLLQFTVAASNPGHALTYALVASVPAATGASIDPATGLFRWTPSEDQGSATYPVTVTITNDAAPPQSGSTTFTITVTETVPTILTSDEEAKKGCAGSAAADPGLAWILALAAALRGRKELRGKPL